MYLVSEHYLHLEERVGRALAVAIGGPGELL